MPCCTMRLYFAGRLDQLPAFEDVVRARLLDVHVLARLAGPDASSARASGWAWRSRWRRWTCLPAACGHPYTPPASSCRRSPFPGCAGSERSRPRRIAPRSRPWASANTSWMCDLPCPRIPTHATRTVSLMLGAAFNAAAPAAAELIRKCRRFMFGSDGQILSPPRSLSSRRLGGNMSSLLQTCYIAKR